MSDLSLTIVTIEIKEAKRGIINIIPMQYITFHMYYHILYLYFSCKDIMIHIAILFSFGPTLNVMVDANIMSRGYSIMAFWLRKVSSFLFFPLCKLDPVIASGSKWDDLGSHLWKTTLRSMESTHSFAFTSVFLWSWIVPTKYFLTFRFPSPSVRIWYLQ